MKKVLVFLALALIANCSFSQTFLAEDAAKHIGDSLTICGKIYGGKFLETSNSAPTFLNMGAAYPNHLLTIFIPLSIRTELGYAPEILLKDKTVCITGKVILYKEKPEIIVYNKAQVEVAK
ncbi:MAG: hypothetical protein ABL929_00535 [Ferruginibacter sp.]|nr:hypothetical protein [Ferruginibacter sp.]